MDTKACCSSDFGHKGGIVKWCCVVLSYVKRGRDAAAGNAQWAEPHHASKEGGARSGPMQRS